MYIFMLLISCQAASFLALLSDVLACAWLADQSLRVMMHEGADTSLKLEPFNGPRVKLTRLMAHEWISCYGVLFYRLITSWSIGPYGFMGDHSLMSVLDPMSGHPKPLPHAGHALDYRIRLYRSIMQSTIYRHILQSYSISRFSFDWITVG